MEKDANKNWNTTLQVCKLKTVGVSSFHHLWLQLYIFYPGHYLRVIVGAPLLVCKKVSDTLIKILERLSIMFTSDGKREFVSGDQVSS